LRNWIFDLPDSKFLLPMFELRFTPEEAEFLSKIPFLPHTAEQLSEKLDMPVDKVTEKLDEFARKGVLTRVEGRTAVRYALGDAVFMFYRNPGWWGKDDEWNRKLAPLLNQYYIDALIEDFRGHPTKGLRAIPINETIKDTRTVMPYEDIVKVIDNFEYYSVSTCACRHRHNLDPDFENCKHETLNCLHFDRLGKYIVQNGLGKEITREETLEILKKAADAGMVHGVTNSEEGMDTICNCCPCCCLFTESIRQIPKGHQPSNYLREMDEEKCKGCGVCVKFCPVDALELEDKKVIYDLDQCIGCGVCVHKCPNDASWLVHCEGEQDYPKNQLEIASRLLKERGREPEEIFEKNI
ncbi:MAG: indolepyruvate ferredoxin oxidoreductase subunit alpha, partial [Candidatus Lokiarchaeia archaeon]